MSGQVFDSCTTGLRSFSAVSRRSAALSRSALDSTLYSPVAQRAVSARPGLLRKRPEQGASTDSFPHLSDFGPGDCAVMPDCHTAPFSLGFARELAVPRYWIFGQPREGNGPCGRETICSARHLR